jgi:putative flippase GtrA
MPLLAGLHQRVTELGPELAKFCVVGMTGAIIDLGGADYLHVHQGMGALAAKGISITVATVVTYLGSRFWTFRHRVNQPMLREGLLFLVLNIIGLIIAEGVIAITTYGLDMKSELAYNAASVVGTGLGTIFRYFSYKKWVFLAHTPAAAVAAGEAAVTGVELTEPAAGTYGPPWDELNPPADPGYGPALEHLDPARPDATGASTGPLRMGRLTRAA